MNKMMLNAWKMKESSICSLPESTARKRDIQSGEEKEQFATKQTVSR